MVERLATGAGYLARSILLLLRVALRMAGPLLICQGVWMIYKPAAYIVAGLMILALVAIPSNGGSDEPA